MPGTRLKRLARRLARPLTSPLDGRVADINRRVNDARLSAVAVGERVSALDHELDAFVSAATESSIYIGADMRRLDESLDKLQTQMGQHEDHVIAHMADAVSRLDTLVARIDNLEVKSYVDRLGRAAKAPLEQLDGAVANLLNHASGHRGFAAQAGLWFNPPVTVELGEGKARLAAVNERIVETAFAFGALARLTPPAPVLEIGSAESTFALSAASLGYQVTALDLHALPYSHPNLTCVVGRFEDWDPGEDRFDAAFLISTIEHFGLGAYGEQRGLEGADRAAVARVGELLNEGGFLTLTTPYGASRVDALERTYDETALAALLEGWTIVDRRTVLRGEKQTWTPCAPGTSSEGAEQGVAMVVATPTRSR